ncbi:MAG TPA: hypothetical protein VF898_11275, partial [Chloroflexota bacterium]
AGGTSGSKITALVLGQVEDSVVRCDSRGSGVAESGSKITALVLGQVEDSVVRCGSRGSGVAESFATYAVASIAW